MGQALLSKREVKLLERTNQLLEEVLETLDIMANKKAMKEIAQSRMEAKAGKTRPFRSLLETVRMRGSFLLKEYTIGDYREPTIWLNNHM